MITSKEQNFPSASLKATSQNYYDDAFSRLLISAFSFIGVLIILAGLIVVDNPISAMILELMLLALILCVVVMLTRPKEIYARVFLGAFSFLGVLIILIGLITVGTNLKASRTLGFIKNSMALFVVVAATRPTDRELKLALIIGIYNVFLDYLVESVAYVMGWWYAVEGTTFPPLLIVPLEMILEFLPLGAAYILIWDLPRSKKDTHHTFFRTLFAKKYFIYVWTLFILVATGLLGVYGDFYAANGSVFLPSPGLTPVHIFFVWSSCGFTMILLHRYLVRRIMTKDPHLDSPKFTLS